MIEYLKILATVISWTVIVLFAIFLKATIDMPSEGNDPAAGLILLVLLISSTVALSWIIYRTTK